MQFVQFQWNILLFSEILVNWKHVPNCLLAKKHHYLNKNYESIQNYLCFQFQIEKERAKISVRFLLPLCSIWDDFPFLFCQ